MLIACFGGENGECRLGGAILNNSSFAEPNFTAPIHDPFSVNGLRAFPTSKINSSNNFHWLFSSDSSSDSREADGTTPSKVCFL